ncbi:MAG TPA: tRNA (adenosine(37)-N6)-threonylcarbamoyltransferase complex dimerization subunit type 1 TsaB [Fibrobacteria bacterium]|nr:tRNA (adenosine(37)-N6)-threonylcarbamoyltransferase complex dimerization subunit type 1 TsaB [Fibrobacteria bacterium]
MPSTPDISLVLDLSAALALGLVDSRGRTLACRLKDQGARGETAHDLLDECLAEAGRDLAAIADICVGVGPGSFTGIRVCAALAQGLAFAKRLPLYPFSSLAALAESAPPGAVSAIAANGGRYFARWRPPGDGAPAPSGSREALVTVDGLQALGVPGTVLVTSGNFPDRERLRPAFSSLERFEERADFGNIARMAHAGTPVSDGVLRPNYLMASAAEEKRRAEGPGEKGPGSAEGDAAAAGGMSG